MVSESSEYWKSRSILGGAIIALLFLTLANYNLMGTVADTVHMDDKSSRNVTIIHRPDFPTESEILVEIFCDLESYACIGFYTELFELRIRYPDIDYSFRHYPLSHHEMALYAAEASECARDAGYFWSYIDAVMTDRSLIDPVRMERLAYEVGVNEENFKYCMQTRTNIDRVLGDIHEAEDRGVRAVPTVFVNGMYIPPPLTFERIAGVIENRLS